MIDYQKLILQNLHYSVIVTDLHGKIIDSVGNIFDLLGYNKNEIKDCNIDRILDSMDPSDPSNSFITFMTNVIENHGNNIITLICKDGSKKLFDTNIKVLEVKPKIVFFTIKEEIVNIFENDLSNDLENNFYEILNSIEDPVFLFDRNLQFRFVNKAFEEAHKDQIDKFESGGIIGYRNNDLFPAEIAEIFNKANQQVLDTGEIILDESEVTIDGEKIISHTMLYPCKDSKGRIIGSLGIARNITKEKKLEATSEEQRSYLKFTNELIDNAPESIFFVNMDNIYEYANKKFAEYHGKPVDEIIGKPSDYLFDKATAERFSRINEEIFQTGKTIKYITDKEIYGARHISSTTKRAYYDKNGEIKGIIGIAHDITREKMLEKKLIETQKMESIGTLAGGFAHDFNNLLSSILGHSEILISDETVPDKRESLSQIINITERAKNITNKLLALGKQGKYRVQAININSLVEEAINILKPYSKKVIQFITQKDENLHSVDGDGSQILQAIINIIINGIEAMQGGGTLTLVTKNIEITPNDEYDLSSGSYIQLDIQDEGIGMGEETIEKIFDPYFTTKRRENISGTGLGLSSAFGIIGNHHGIITVQSKIASGSNFTILLPRGKLSIQAMKTTDQKVQSGSGLILIIDDNEEILKVLKKFLSKMGYDVYTAVSGKEGIKIYKEKYRQISLVIIDMILPLIDGYNIYKALLQINKNVTGILITGYSKDGRVQDLLDLGIKEVVYKPFSMKKISRIIKKHI